MQKIRYILFSERRKIKETPKDKLDIIDSYQLLCVILLYVNEMDSPLPTDRFVSHSRRKICDIRYTVGMKKKKKLRKVFNHLFIP